MSTGVPPVNEPMKIGVFGASLDPVHVGHLMAVVYAISCGGMDEVWVIPCGEHPHGKPLSDFKHRYNMAIKAFYHIANCRVLELEQHLSKPSYTNATLKHIKDGRPNADLHLIVGQDVARDMPNWKDGGRTLELAKLIVIPRSGFDGSGEDHLLPEVSSTKIRESIRQGKSVERHLDLGVRDYIEQNQLYVEVRNEASILQ